MYGNGELKTIYHPEGDEALRIAPGEQFSFGPGCRAAKPTPPSAENDTEFVFDYFIKDYLGNVRVVMTEEDATYTDKFLATLEDVHAYIEEVNFENLEEVREDLPTGYPVNGSVSLNERIALLNAANGTEIGPSIVLPVKQGEKVSLSTEYFYTEDAAGATYDNIDFLINEVLIAFAAGGSGILPLNETQLIDIASGQGNYSNALANLFNNEIDTTDMSRPYAYMVWTAYDANMNIISSASGIERVSDPNDLEILIREEIAIAADGFLHAYVSNGSAVGVNFDNFQVTTMRGKVRQINHYYPYGLTISGIGTNSDEYLNKYTTKELQTGEWNPAVSNGLEMYDYSLSCLFFSGAHEIASLSFHARHYDPQLGRWFASTTCVPFASNAKGHSALVYPAEQFSNPYLAMGRTKREESLRGSDLASGQPAGSAVMYVDPDGEFIVSAMIIGAMIGSFTSAVTAGYSGASNGQIMANFGIGAAVGAATGAAGKLIGGAGSVSNMGLGNVGSTKSALAKFLSNPAVKAGLRSGTVNALSNYNYDNGFKDIGLGTIADFGAGFVGGTMAVESGSKLVGMFAGGLLNTAINTQTGDGLYEHAQRFTGGALSVYAGTDKLVKGKSVFKGGDNSVLKMQGKNVFSKTLMKYGDSFFKYGLQSTAYDFAYTEQKYFVGKYGREWYEHVGMFGVGGLAGLGSGQFMTNRSNEMSSLARISLGAGTYAAEWLLPSRIKYGSYARYNGYESGGFYTGSSQKAKGWVSGFKWSLPSYEILFR